MNRRSALRTLSLGAPLIAAAGPAYGQRLADPPTVSAKACIVIDVVTGQPLFEKNADEKRPVASTQKLVTALIIAELGGIDRTCTVTLEDTKVEPSNFPLRKGETWTRRALLNAMLIESCNDAATCLARNAAGNLETFAEWMNRRAAKLGMKNSKFLNPSGLPADQHSTARDMSRVARSAIYNPTIRSIVQQHTVVLNRPDGSKKTLDTTNYLLRPKNRYYTPICTGMKTGFTNAAGKCLISSGTYRGRAIICVMLGSNSKIIWPESRAVLHWALGVTA